MAAFSSRGDTSSGRPRRTVTAGCLSLSTVLCLALALLVLLWVLGTYLLLSGGDSNGGSVRGLDVAHLLRRRSDLAQPQTPQRDVMFEVSNDIIGRPPHLLSGISRGIVVTASVRGNLGPPSVVLNSGNDWIKDRWQAAADMGGTAIKGQHWIQLDFPSAVIIYRVVLDWEAAYCDDYILEAMGSDAGDFDADKKEVSSSWRMLYDWSNSFQRDLRIVSKLGQSPGVKTKTPLHVLHAIGPLREQDGSESNQKGTGTAPLRSLRMTMRRPASGWGVSLWRFEVYGTEAYPL